MALSDCPHCWETPCVCSPEARERAAIEEAAARASAEPWRFIATGPFTWTEEEVLPVRPSGGAG